MDFRMQDRMELKALVDFYATESDKNNQDCYVEIFRPDIKLNVYFGGKLGMTANDVHDMIRQYKAFGAAKVSFPCHRYLLRAGNTGDRAGQQRCIDNSCSTLLR